MIDPNLLKIRHQRFADRARGTKFYRAEFKTIGGMSHFSRRQFRTATDAEDYGARVKLRWMRLRDAWEMVRPVEAA